MMKIALPILLAGIVMIAGIFAFIPIDKATTVHTTIQSTQLNNIDSTFDTQLRTNATATCSTGDFLVYWTFTNSTAGGTASSTSLNIDDGVGNGQPDIAVTLTPLNQTSISGVIGGKAGETITFSGLADGDVGDLALTVHCQSTATPTVVPTPD